jgi:hypothetical protein
LLRRPGLSGIQFSGAAKCPIKLAGFANYAFQLLDTHGKAFNVEQRVNLNLVRSADADQSRIDPERQGRKVLAVVRQADTGV